MIATSRQPRGVRLYASNRVVIAALPRSEIATSQNKMSDQWRERTSRSSQAGTAVRRRTCRRATRRAGLHPALREKSSRFADRGYPAVQIEWKGGALAFRHREGIEADRKVHRLPTLLQHTGDPRSSPPDGIRSEHAGEPTRITVRERGIRGPRLPRPTHSRGYSFKRDRFRRC
jgi:hypothetical protein